MVVDGVHPAEVQPIKKTSRMRWAYIGLNMTVTRFKPDFIGAPLYYIRRAEGHRVVESRDPSKPGLRGTSDLGVVTKMVRGSEASRVA